MNKSVVTFFDPNQNQTVEINFELNDETTNLDYYVRTDPDLKEGDPLPSNLNFWLANFFLNALRNMTEATDNENDNESEAN